ncbi:MAG TPA: YihY/virulence factor BrkB family protein [Burkholderiales bacterium]|nr:YihY/virulence factor BrkB family protein [Burkholderiales bacterium]
MATAGIAGRTRRARTQGKGRFKPLRKFLHAHAIVWERILKVLGSWSADRCVSESAALGFFAAFSLAPMLVVVIAFAGFFFGADAVQGRLFAEIESLMGKEGAEVMQAMVANAWKTGSSGWVGYLSVAGVIVGASATFSELTSALNWIWRAPEKQGAVATLIKVRLLSFGLVLGTGFLLIVLLIMDAALSFAGGALVARHDNLTGPLVEALQHAFTFVVLFGAFSVLLKIVPNVHVRWRDAVLGAFVATGLFSIGKHFLALYLAHAGTASAFGAAGSLAIVMMWLFFSAAVFLLGAEVAAHALPRSVDPELKVLSESRARKR